MGKEDGVIHGRYVCSPVAERDIDVIVLSRSAEAARVAKNNGVGQVCLNIYPANKPRYRIAEDCALNLRSQLFKASTALALASPCFFRRLSMPVCYHALLAARAPFYAATTWNDGPTDSRPQAMFQDAVKGEHGLSFLRDKPLVPPRRLLLSDSWSINLLVLRIQASTSGTAPNLYAPAKSSESLRSLLRRRQTRQGLTGRSFSLRLPNRLTMVSYSTAAPQRLLLVPATFPSLASSRASGAPQ